MKLGRKFKCATFDRTVDLFSVFWGRVEKQREGVMKFIRERLIGSSDECAINEHICAHQTIKVL